MVLGHQALQFLHRLFGQRRATKAAQLRHSLGRLLRAWLEVDDAMQAQEAPDSVLDGDAVAHQGVAFPSRPSSVFFGLARNAHHRADTQLPAQERQQRPQQHVEIDPVGLGSPFVPRHR